MKQVIDGKVYNTETAQHICDCSNAYNPGDFKHHSTDLYRTKKGQYFLSGKGGPLSLWGEGNGNGMTSGRGIKLITQAEALEWAEGENLDEDQLIAAGFSISEG